MKLYAIRDKETGELYRVAGKPAVFTKPDAPTKHLVNESRELVTLRIEPTEPCEWCGDITTGGVMTRLAEEGCVTLVQTCEKMLPMHEWHFCPNCGRRLGDE